MVRWRSLIVVLLAATAASPALACETEPSLVRLPGETAEAFEARNQKTQADQWVIRKYWRESFAYKHASAVYIARVVTSDRPKSAPGQAPPLDHVTVKFLHAVRGRMPATERKLEVTARASCGNYGDGDAASASVGEIVFVFEGLSKSEQRPNGIDSILAADARTYELLDPLYEFGSEHSF